MSPAIKQKGGKGCKAGGLDIAPFFDLSLDMLCIAGTDGYFKMVNPAFTSTLGYKTEELLHQPFVDFVHPDDRANTLREVQSLAAGLKTVRFSNRYRTADGRYLWIEWNAAPEPTGAYIYAVARDITERRESEELFRMVVNGAPNAVLLMDAEGSVVLANPRAERIFGKVAADLVHRDFRALCSPGDLARLREAMEKCQNGVERVMLGETNMLQASGQTFPADVILSRSSSEEANYLLAVVVDLSEKKQSQMRLEASEEQLVQTQQEIHRMQDLLMQAEKMDSLGRLASGVAHEVKNPLAMLQLGLEFVTRRVRDPDEKLASTFVGMQHAIDRADRIISEMLDISRTRQIELTWHSLNDVAREAIHLSRHELIKSKIEAKEDFWENLPPAKMDAHKMQQVLLNLMVNAMHAMPRGGTLTIRTYVAVIEDIDRDEGVRTADHMRALDRVVGIEIEDTGTGIPEEFLRKIWDPFFTTKPTGVGTGLGLAVVKGIVDLHRGRVSLSNRPGGGAMARIILPTLPKNAPFPGGFNAGEEENRHNTIP